MAVIIGDRNNASRQLKVNEDGSIDVNVELEVSDIQIGAVEIKDGITDVRQTVKTDGTDNAAVVIANVLPLPTGAATSIKQLLDGHNVTTLSDFQIPFYDYIALTYVVSGNGAGEIETVIYKDGGLSGTTVATLTIAYNSSNEISSVTKTWVFALTFSLVN